MYKKLNLSKAILTFGVFVFSFQLNAQETVIKQSELPKAAQNFISENFSGQKVIQSIKDVDYLVKTEYEVYLNNNVKIEFDADGNWKEVDGNDTAIPTKFISKKINQYVSQNFPTQKITKIEKSSTKFEVELLNGPDLEFNSKGDFLRIDD